MDTRHLFSHLRKSDIKLYEALNIINNDINFPYPQIRILNFFVDLGSVISYNLTLSDILIVIVTQNISGTGTIVWGDQFLTGTPTTINATAGGRTAFIFLGLEKWVLLTFRDLP